MPVYAIRAGETEFVKIGWADDVNDRLRSLQTAHYEVLRLLRVIEAPFAAEAWLHRHFAHLRVRFEWFRFHPDMLTVEPPTEFPTPHDDGVAALRAWDGSLAEVARKIGVTRAAISMWRQIPADRMLDIEAATGIPREKLRPDLFRTAAA
jgi:hypothetical protein